MHIIPTASSVSGHVQDFAYSKNDFMLVNLGKLVLWFILQVSFFFVWANFFPWLLMLGCMKGLQESRNDRKGALI